MRVLVMSLFVVVVSMATIDGALAGSVTTVHAPQKSVKSTVPREFAQAHSSKIETPKVVRLCPITGPSPLLERTDRS
jgi:hypothetical protein